MSNSYPKTQIQYSRQRGIALIVTLILLLTMTLVGLAGMRSNTQQERMAGNFRDRNLAFQASESGLMAGEDAVRAATTFTIDGPWLAEGTDLDVALPSGNHWEPWQNAQLTVLVAQDPEYVIEPAGVATLDPEKQYTVADVEFENFRVTARGYGGTPQAQVIVQSLFMTDFIGGSLE